MRHVIRHFTSFAASTARVSSIALFGALFGLTMVSADAVAAQPEDADDAALKSGGEKGKTAVYDFDDDSVDGELLRPEGANIASRSRKKHASLITIRPHFISELIRPPP